MRCGAAISCVRNVRVNKVERGTKNKSKGERSSIMRGSGALFSLRRSAVVEVLQRSYRGVTHAMLCSICKGVPRVIQSPVSYAPAPWPPLAVMRSEPARYRCCRVLRGLGLKGSVGLGLPVWAQ